MNSKCILFAYNYQQQISTVPDFQICACIAELAATLFFDEIRQHVDERKLVGATFIDLSKAFDTISHSNLLQKLLQYGICDEELGWFTDYLFHRSVVVSYGSCLSNKQDILTGVPQGSILGPLVFIIFFNDKTDVIEVAKIVKYAGDTVICS